jgi:hypothetical protein
MDCGDLGYANKLAKVRNESKDEILAKSRCFPLYPQERTRTFEKNVRGAPVSFQNFLEIFFRSRRRHALSNSCSGAG